MCDSAWHCHAWQGGIFVATNMDSWFYYSIEVIIILYIIILIFLYLIMYFLTYSDSVTKTPPCHAWQCHAPLICFVFFLKFTKVHSAFCPSKRTTTWTGRDTRLRPSQSDISHRINDKGHELRTHGAVRPYLPSEISRTYHNHFSSPLIFTPQGEVFL